MNPEASHYTLKPIGFIYTNFTDPITTPIQPSRSQAAGRVEIFPEYAAGLQDLEGFSHLILIYLFHQAGEVSLLVRPFLDDKPRGLFSTRFPSRPNQLGLSIVLLEQRKDHILFVRGIDTLNHTPLLDIKPFFPEFDQFPGEVRTGWYSERSKR